MNESSFDTLARSLINPSSRRGLLRGLVTMLGLKVTGFPNGADAKRRKKPRPNEFGCLNGGKACGGKDERCCSGICQGKKPKKGKKDKSRCVAHNVGGCTLDRSVCFTNPTLALCSATALCTTTTGNAPFCAETKDFKQEVNCQPCGKDKDCEALGFGAGSACTILRTEGTCLDGCEGINESSGAACFPPGR